MLVSQFNVESNLILRLINNGKNVEDFILKTLYGQELANIRDDIEIEMGNIRKQIKDTKMIYLNDEEKEDVSNYYDLLNRSYNVIGNKRKRIQWEINKVKDGMTKNSLMYVEYKDKNNCLTDQYKTLFRKQETWKSEIDDIISNSKVMYIELGLYNMHSGLTIYGKIVANLSNCSEILLGHLIVHNFFDDMSAKDIGIILSLMIEEKNNVDKNDIDVYPLSVSMKELIYKIYDINLFIEGVFGKYGYGYKNNLTVHFIIPMILWMEGVDCNEVLAKYEGYDGNFIRNIYKIRDICFELVSICEMFQMGGLLSKVNDLSDMIIKGITKFNSLYVQHYNLI